MEEYKMANYLRPKRGKKSSAETQAIVLKKGEIFFEIGNNGKPTTGPNAISFGKIKMGDGTTTYSNLGYFTDVDTTAVDWDNSGYTSATSASQGVDLYGNLNAITPSATIKSIFGNIKALLYKLATKVTTLNNVTDDAYDKLYKLDTKVTILNDVTKEQIDDINDKVPFSFGIDGSGNYGYKKAGADTVTPFKTVGTRGEITTNGTYTAISDINKDGYSSVKVNVASSVQTKTVTAGTSNINVTPDSGYVGMSKVTVAPTPTETKNVTASTSAQTITPSSGKHIGSVTVNPTPTETKTATPSASSQTITPSSGKHLSSVIVNPINLQTKHVNPSTSTQEVTPDSGKYLAAATVGRIETQVKEFTAVPDRREVIPDSGAYLSKVIVKPQVHDDDTSRNYRIQATDDDIDDIIDLGPTHNIRYIHIHIDAPR
jgi:hypothetical protein